jgi:hypothetical protein
MAEISDARAGNEPHIPRANHCNAHRFCSSLYHCRSPMSAAIPVLRQQHHGQMLCVVINLKPAIRARAKYQRSDGGPACLANRGIISLL